MRLGEALVLGMLLAIVGVAVLTGISIALHVAGILP